VIASILFYADRIQKPLLIGRGANAPRVKQAESEQIVDAMRQANRPVEDILYPDEGHGVCPPGKSAPFLWSG
jgi:dipeptidyl aminopeptidase/acylaminoacyl peptidase